MKFSQYLAETNDEIMRFHGNQRWCTNVKAYIIGGPYFTYKGVKYGEGTSINFTEDFKRRFSNYKRRKAYPNNAKMAQYNMIEYKYVWWTNKPSIFKSRVIMPDGTENWYCGALAGSGFKIDPDRDIESIPNPVYWVERPTKREVVRHRLSNGTWFDYIWPHTLIYAGCLIISPIFTQWYLIWTIGLYLYLRLSYEELAKL